MLCFRERRKNPKLEGISHPKIQTSHASEEECLGGKIEELIGGNYQKSNRIGKSENAVPHPVSSSYSVPRIPAPSQPV